MQVSRRQHLQNTIARYRETEDKLDDMHLEYGYQGMCCPSCAIPDYRELAEKQERRARWLAINGIEID